MISIKDQRNISQGLRGWVAQYLASDKPMIFVFSNFNEHYAAAHQLSSSKCSYFDVLAETYVSRIRNNLDVHPSLPPKARHSPFRVWKSWRPDFQIYR